MSRRWLTYLLLLLAAALAGYLATLVIVPANLPGSTALVPQLRGLSQIEAVGRLDSLGLRIRLADEMPDHNMASGLVSWQSPAPGTELPPGALVQVALSSGNPMIIVPDLRGLDAAMAFRLLSAAGLKGAAVDSTDAPDEAGTVMSSNPAFGASIRAGSPVTVYVSRGPELVLVPYLLGLPVGEARQILKHAGLRTGNFSQQRSSERAGLVLDQAPGAGTLVTRGSKVDMTVSGADQ